ncbi:unnamed protein product [Heterobilharzia americana]|nr:unnamed protein product [Heterobilharzia americana]
MDYRASAARLHCTLFSPVFSTWIHHSPQAFIYSSHHLHVILSWDAQLDVSNSTSTRGRGLACHVMSPIRLLSVCPITYNPSPLSSVYLLGDGFLLRWFVPRVPYCLFLRFWPSDLQYQVSVGGSC